MKYFNITKPQFLRGDSRWWLAENIGTVKYEMAMGSGDLLAAKIGERKLPSSPTVGSTSRRLH